MKDSKILRAVGSLAMIVIIFTAGWLGGQSAASSRSDATPPADASQATAQQPTEPINLSIDFGNGEILAFDDVTLADNDASLFDVLAGLQAQDKITLDYEDYGGDLGVFLKGMNGVPEKPSSDKWWQYWVNNEYSQVGVSSYWPQPGDRIEFKFADGQVTAP